MNQQESYQEEEIDIIQMSPLDPKKKLNIFLDLDNTLLSAIPLEDMKWNKANKEKALCFKVHNMEDYYVIFERPGLQEFLDYLFKNYNVNVWSAASKDYVAFIIQEIILIKPERKLGYVLFSYHCDLSKKIYNKGIKDLRLVWEYFDLPGLDPSNTLIIDDLVKVKKINKENCIDIKEFEFEDEDSEHDNEFESIKERIENFGN